MNISKITNLLENEIPKILLQLLPGVYSFSVFEKNNWDIKKESFTYVGDPSSLLKIKKYINQTLEKLGIKADEIIFNEEKNLFVFGWKISNLRNWIAEQVKRFKSKTYEFLEDFFFFSYSEVQQILCYFELEISNVEFLFKEDIKRRSNFEVYYNHVNIEWLDNYGFMDNKISKTNLLFKDANSKKPTFVENNVLSKSQLKYLLLEQGLELSELDDYSIEKIGFVRKNNFFIRKGFKLEDDILNFIDESKNKRIIDFTNKYSFIPTFILKSILIEHYSDKCIFINDYSILNLAESSNMVFLNKFNKYIQMRFSSNSKNFVLFRDMIEKESIFGFIKDKNIIDYDIFAKSLLQHVPFFMNIDILLVANDIWIFKDDKRNNKNSVLRDFLKFINMKLKISHLNSYSILDFYDALSSNYKIISSKEELKNFLHGKEARQQIKFSLDNEVIEFE